VLDTLKLGLYILLLLPGFLFVQVREYHLLREKKPQFEKSLEIILGSCFIWTVALALPWWWPWPSSRASIVREAAPILEELAGHSTADHAVSTASLQSYARFFFAVCLWSFIAANAWGAIRKNVRIDRLIKYLTGRSWYPSVALQFFKYSLDQAVIVTSENKRYLGILASAPDTYDDQHLLLTDVSILPKEGEAAGGQTQPEALPLVDFMILKFQDVTEIQKLKSSVLETKPPVLGPEEKHVEKAIG
jgi:Family of unknown function (DUF6338)